MQEVSKKSVNGGSQVSGGFIFDKIDRFAHDYLKNKYKVKGFLLTSVANVFYAKQICNWDSVNLVALNYYYNENDATYWIRIKAVDKKNDTLYTSAHLEFVEKDHAYCDIKEK